MRYISHRGNTNGRNVGRENRLDYIGAALNDGFDVEIDVRLIDGKLFLGHDKPQQEITLDFLLNHRLWVHAKNVEALHFLIEQPVCVFWHDKDAYTLTSWGDVWAYPGSKLTPSCVAVMPESLHSDFYLKDEEVAAEIVKKDIGPSWGVCSDYVGLFRSYWEHPLAE